MFSKLHEIERVHITIAGLADRQLFYKYNFFSNVNYVLIRCEKGELTKLMCSTLDLFAILFWILSQSLTVISLYAGIESYTVCTYVEYHSIIYGNVIGTLAVHCPVLGYLRIYM